MSVDASERPSLCHTFGLAQRFSRYDRAKGPEQMNQSEYQIKQLADELPISAEGKQSVVLTDNAKTKVILFSFAAGGGLAEHVAPFDATIQIVSGTAMLTVGDEAVEGKPGTWIQMAAKTPLRSWRRGSKEHYD